MDWTPLIHALIAIAAQLLVGLLTGNWWLGGAGFSEATSGNAFHKARTTGSPRIWGLA